MSRPPGALPGSLGERWPSWAAGDSRRAAAARKLAVYHEDHLPLVRATIREFMGHGEVAHDVGRFAKRAGNVAKATTDAIAVAYRSGCRRELKGASPALARAFADLVAESQINQYAAGWNARSWIAGPHALGPALNKRGKLVIDVISPAHLDVRLDGDDIDAALWQVGGEWVEADADAWRYFDKRGEEYRPPTFHGVGVCPLVPFRSFDGGDDWWAASAHSGLVDATLLISYKIASGLYQRQVSGTPLVTIFTSDEEKMAAGQTLGHPVQPMVLGGSAKVQVDADRVVKADDYLAEITAYVAMAVSTEGLPPGSISLQASNNDWGSLAINAEGSRLAGHRDRQVPFVKRSELEFWPVAFDFLRAGGVHRHASKLPPGDEAREMLRINFPDLSSVAERRERLELMKAEQSFGLSSPSDLALAAQPELTREEVEELRKERTAEYVASLEPMIKGNVPAEAPKAHGVETLAQVQGRRGGEASGAARAA